MSVLPKESYEVPLYSKDQPSRSFFSLYRQAPTRGTIRYHASKQVLEKVPGFFSFTFYLPDRSTMWFRGKGSNIYFRGLGVYLTLVKTVPEFQGWRLLVYTDKASLDQLLSIYAAPKPRYGDGSMYGEEEWGAVQTFFKNPEFLTFVTVDWPSHSSKPGVPQVNGAVLRPLRSRAPFDFPNATIFIRDADTLFEGDLRQAFNPERMEYFQERVNAWETTFLKLIPELQAFKGTPSLLIVGSGSPGGSSRIYHKDWHENEILHKKSPFGIFAGFVNITPGVPVYQTKDAWDEFVDYVEQRSVRQMNKPMNPLVREYLRTHKNKSYPVSKEDLNAYIKEVASYSSNPNAREQSLRGQLKNIFYPFSNDGTKHSIGRDEQMYLFILMPKALENLVIFKIDLEDTTPPVWTNVATSKLDPKNPNFTDPYERANYHSRLFNAYRKTLNTGFQTISKVKLKKPKEDESLYNEEQQTNILEYNEEPLQPLESQEYLTPTPPVNTTNWNTANWMYGPTGRPSKWGPAVLQYPGNSESHLNDPSLPRPQTPLPTNGNNPVVSGGKRKARKTRRQVRSKIEKRKTRRHR